MKAVRGDKTGTAAALMVFCVFTVSVLTVLTLGVDAYKNVTDVSREGYEERVCLSYIWTKIKNGDKAGMIFVEDFQGLSALRLDEVYDGVTYRTLIYSYEGRLYELFFEAGLEFSPGDGAPVINNESLSFEWLEDGRLMKITAGAESVFISPRGRTGPAFAAKGGVER
jgi:hypothetical protein